MDFAIGILGLRKKEFLEMTWGEYITICIGHQKKTLNDLHKYRNILGSILRTDPKKIFSLPGDFDHVPKPMTQEEIEQELIRLGVGKFHGIKAEA